MSGRVEVRCNRCRQGRDLAQGDSDTHLVSSVTVTVTVQSDNCELSGGLVVQLPLFRERRVLLGNYNSIIVSGQMYASHRYMGWLDCCQALPHISILQYKSTSSSNRYKGSNQGSLETAARRGLRVSRQVSKGAARYRKLWEK